ncbi:alpha/beta hydrolase fold protein [Arcobacter nitrofigilis DSM 7299]|uniref:Alpha/beta hydrolase fold protein n=1 Tax=Arcobacter nitrofigilis (strain ATCC 33309 / DSM 7299 / CCUG 15893 / LMG 7604 / NCTC 12251 / CI) TaxID=572480 RepID=D5V1W3_ARCNC|nr:alpha/beta fold hydrolase [Arcobacter nitrofigilis]ADG93547.1 alpha/beta hydrolase fold protein [Arcobacter nitrofigilis DSM 7299]
MKRKIYLIPGFMNDEKLWSRLIPLFDDTYEFIHLEIPKKDSFDEIVEVLNDKIKDEKINLLGFSLGGYISCYFGLKYPNRINKILAVACSPANLNEIECQRRRETIELTKKFGFKGLSRKKVLSLVEPKNQGDEELINLILQMYIDVGEEAFYSQFKATIIREDLSEKLINSDLNLAFLYANEDRLVSSKFMENFSLKAKNIEVTQIEAQTHMLPLERTKEVKEKIIQWF